MKFSSPWRCTVIVTLLMLAISMVPGSSQGITTDPFSRANNAVNSAFSSIYYSEQNGGDVSVLVDRLDTAVFLIQRASVENATDPNAAAADLSNATTIAQTVSLAAASVSSTGSTAHQLLLYESIGTTFAAIGVATLAYLRGDRVYRRLWLYTYRNHVVRKNDE